MASNSSGALSPSQTYSLGIYAFQLRVTKVAAENTTAIQGRVTKDGSVAMHGIDEPGTNIVVDSWRVEAEEKAATVYATMHKTSVPISPNPLQIPIPHAAYAKCKTSWRTFEHGWAAGTGELTTVKSHSIIYSSVDYTCLYASSNQNAVGYYQVENDPSTMTEVSLQSSYTYLGQTVYFAQVVPANGYGERAETSSIGWCNNGSALERPFSLAASAWYLVYSEPDHTPYEKLIGRFEINVQDAGGQTWDNPADVGEPSKTLNLTVAGALSGRHNDPINDSSYHYYPSDREQAEIYGSGGVGGNGGGGGAGASTVIVHQFGTDKAGSTDVTAIAKRHGYGSGGGKGGKGGDGCILVYY